MTEASLIEGNRLIDRIMKKKSDIQAWRLATGIKSIDLKDAYSSMTELSESVFEKIQKTAITEFEAELKELENKFEYL